MHFLSDFLIDFFHVSFFLSPCFFPNNVLYFVLFEPRILSEFSSVFWICLTCDVFMFSQRPPFFPISFFKLYQCYNLWNEDIGYGSEQKINSFYIQENVTFRAYSYISSALCRIAVFTMGLFSRGSICLMAQGILSKSYR